jgi:glycosyltransferase involved in cell wall biosynthesis
VVLIPWFGFDACMEGNASPAAHAVRLRGRVDLYALPPVSVIMAVHNGAHYVAEAIESVLRQTHQGFEFIVVDDGSTDATSQILAEFAAHDGRMEVISQANTDQPESLNRALAEASNDWVAVFDADDVCMSHRLDTQLRMLQQEPSIRVLGASAVLIDSNGEIRGIRHHPPSSVSEYRKMVRENDVIRVVHPSVMMHRPTILALGGYDPSFGPAADAELWGRVSDNHVIVNLPDPVIYYRMHSDSMSVRRFGEQRRRYHWIRARQEARRKGLPQPTLEQFNESRESWFSFNRLNNSRQDWAKYLGTRSRIDWWEGCYLQAVLERTGTVILTPRAGARRFMSSP